jgi:phosphoribosyl 1,2-cyclic phosphodiesterase
MSLFIASLNSGSNGNCYYIGNGEDAVLVDAGLSCRETERRMQAAGLSLQKVRGIFVSHEHGDHIKGVQGISKKHNIPVYVTEATKKSGKLFLYSHLVKPFAAGEVVQVFGLNIIAFAKYHDAADPHSFVVEGNGVTIGVFTDLGKVCDGLVHHFKKCHAAFLESNYDASMLENGRYPIHLKNRIRGGHGHLSNDEALELFKTHRPPHMSHLLLAHLSKENNKPEIVSDLFNAQANGVRITVASRYEVGEVFEVRGNGLLTEKRKAEKMVQVSLF